jgi:hypothetical protein
MTGNKNRNDLHRGFVLRSGLASGWHCILQFALILWVIRVPLSTTVFGLALLGLAPQAQDLFVEFARAPIWRMFVFLLVLIFVWAMPTHYAARLLVDTDARLQGNLEASREPTKCLRASAIHAPRILGLLTFVAVLIAIFRSHLNLPNLDQKEVIAGVDRALVEIALLVCAGAAGFVYYVLYRPRDADLPLLRSIKRTNEKLAGVWRTVSPGVRDPQGTDDEQARNLGRLLLLAIFAIFLSIFAFGADSAGQLFPRAMAVPFILGGWLPLLSYLSGLGRSWRAPLIIGLFVVVAAVAIVLGDNHSVRRINAATTIGHPVETSPMPLDAAVRLWMQENHCNDSAGKCPRPIIVAAAGGASRAAFFMATILGYLMQEAEAHELDPNQVRNRLFAISGVSGGSVGAVMVTAALDAKNDSNDHPCIRSSAPLWWGDTINNWRDCFEALTSGDFLTADFFGFAFNDMLPVNFWRDRAAVLEDAWNNRYQTVLTRGDQPAIVTKCKGLDCPFLALRPRPGHWIPLLVLNGTSEATGGRIITTVLAATYKAPTYCPTVEGQPNCPLFLEAERFHDLLTYNAAAAGWLGGFERWLLGGRSVDDIRLSTAAHNSARFPLISPPGSIRNQNQAIVDRIVDGAYFENYGALAAKELALALIAVEPRLTPLVIVISNDPNDLIDPSDDSISAQAKSRLQKNLQTQARKARALVNGSEVVTEISAPLTTVANTQTAHGILGVDQLHNALHEARPQCGARFIQIHVWPQFDSVSNQSKEVSMSWWLSTPIQRHLHQQTEGVMDGNQNSAHLDALWAAMKTTSASCEGNSR